MKLYLLFVSCILILLLIDPNFSRYAHEHGNFFQHHGFLILIGWYLFPRIMFWFFSAITGGFWFWIGVFFTPQIMMAYWATKYYWTTNPILCLIAWLTVLHDENPVKLFNNVSEKCKKIHFKMKISQLIK